MGLHSRPKKTGGADDDRRGTLRDFQPLFPDDRSSPSYAPPFVSQAWCMGSLGRLFE